jgi:hypothetical protein
VGFVQHDKTEEARKRMLSLRLSLRPFWILVVEWLVLLFSPCLVSHRPMLKAGRMGSVGWMEKIFVGRMEEEGG